MGVNLAAIPNSFFIDRWHILANLRESKFALFRVVVSSFVICFPSVRNSSNRVGRSVMSPFTFDPLRRI